MLQAEELKAKTVDELNDQLLTLKKEQFNLRFQQANAQLNNTSEVRRVRRDIARISTVLTEKRKESKTK
tara:strand:+ start:587 stop:793 length:207 start_codon:yes stop_codon:yes gene_type:complete